MLKASFSPFDPLRKSAAPKCCGAQRLDDVVPGDHPVRRIAAVLDLSWVYSELAPYYPRIGRPSVDRLSGRFRSEVRNYVKIYALTFCTGAGR